MWEKGLSGSTLKLMAMLSMLIDHIGAILLVGSPYYDNCRAIGRLAFPIYCFLLVEGYIHTRDVKKYGIRLFLSALISEIPFDLAFSGSVIDMGYQNVFFTLVIGLMALYIIDHAKNPGLQAVLLLAAMMAAELLKTDYSWAGVAAIAVIYAVREKKLWQAVAGGMMFAWEMPAPAAFVPIYFYNGKRGISMKYLFYLFYPAHLLVLVVIRYFIN